MKTKKKKIIKKAIIALLKKVAYYLLIILLVYNIVYNIYHAIKPNGILGFWGYKMLIMEDSSMEGAINKNDIVIIRKCKETELDKQDIIAYNLNTSIRYVTIHRITDIIGTPDGREYTTKGDKNYHYDSKKLTIEDIGGKVIFRIPKTGWIIKIFQSRIITVLLIIYLFMRFKYTEHLEKQNRRREKRIKARHKK